MKSKFLKGQISLEILFFASIMVILMTGFIFLAQSFLQLSARGYHKSLAFTIAEAGIEYYRWHLAHAPTDYYDGQGATSTGPYVHNYYDKNGTILGQFALTITPPATGSTVVTVESKGTIIADSSVQKIIRVRFGQSSLARYAVLSNSSLRFGTGTEVFGELFSNGGIRFDGIAHNIVKSAQSQYDDPDHGGGDEFGVHTHVAPLDPTPPAAVPNRPDVFMAGRQFPVPAVDFSGLTQDLADIRTAAQSGGVYATSSGSFGYNLKLFANDRYELYRVTALTPPPNGCTNTSNQSGWGTWTIQTQVMIASSTFPSNGIFFLEDNVWVEGVIDGARLTIAAGLLPDNPSNRKSITVNSDLRYTNYDGTDAIALIAQDNFNVGLYSSDILRIDSALVAQNGRVGRYYYQPPNLSNGNNRCGNTVTRQRITLFGSIGSNQRYGFGYTDVTGYLERVLIFDDNLLYAPPPNFPLGSDQYTQISWEEVQ